jgi:hypothetical protein
MKHSVLEVKQTKARIVFKDEVRDGCEIDIGLNSTTNNFNYIGVDHGVQKLKFCTMIKVIFCIKQSINLDGLKTRLKRNRKKGSRSMNPRRILFKCKCCIEPESSLKAA